MQLFHLSHLVARLISWIMRGRRKPFTKTGTYESGRVWVPGIMIVLTGVSMRVFLCLRHDIHPTLQRSSQGLPKDKLPQELIDNVISSVDHIRLVRSRVSRSWLQLVQKGLFYYIYLYENRPKKWDCDISPESKIPFYVPTPPSILGYLPSIGELHAVCGFLTRNRLR